MLNFSVIGNCQTDAIVSFLLSNNEFINKYNYIKIKNIHILNNDEIDYIYDNILKNLDLIIIQPISENYKDYRFSTISILNHLKSDCIKILFPSLYFDYYHPFLTYVYNKNVPGWKLDQPYDYHDKNIIKLYVNYKNDNSIDILNNYFSVLYNDNLLDENFFNERLKINISNLKDREKNYHKFCTNDTFIIISSDYILENYKNNLLFYSMNHPTKYLFKYICNKILTLLNIQLDEYPEDLDPLESLVMPLYSCIKKNINFDISIYQNFRHYKIIFDDNNMINSYINVYDTIDIEILKNVNS